MYFPTLLHHYLEMNAQRFPRREALVCGDERWTYKALNEAAVRLAGGFIRRGLKRGDRVVIFADNSPEVVISIYAALKAGAVFVVLNGSLKPGKLRYILEDSGAALLITNSNKREVVEKAVEGFPRKRPIIWAGEDSSIPEILAANSIPWASLLECETADYDSPPIATPRTIDCDLAALIYTSGSTGEPKGVMSTHANMVAAARSIIQYVGNVEDDIVIDVLPLSFDYGLYQVLMVFTFGGTLVLEKSFLFPVRILETIAREKVTGFPIVPTIAAFLIGMKNLDRFDLSSLRYMTNTAAALPVDHIRRLRSAFPRVKLFSMYGLTECKRVAYLPPEELDTRPASVGKAIPNCETFIVDEHGSEVEPGAVGELVVRGANVMQGYWSSPELTAKVFRPGRYPGERLLYSGDLFREDEEGFLYFVGRKDDMIKTRGERVSPKEIENILSAMDGIAEAAVIGIPDPILGQAVKAFLVRRSGIQVTENDVMRYCVDNLESFMMPKVLEFLPALPKTANGKTDKKMLMEGERARSGDLPPAPLRRTGESPYCDGSGTAKESHT